MTRILTIDFETHDPYIERKLGAGWVYGVNVESSDFEVLGAAVRTHEGEVYYETNMERVNILVDSHDVLIMHNASYDLGCLHFIGSNCRNKHLFDTEVMSRLYNSSLLSHSLDNVAKKYLGIGKDEKALTDAVWKHNLYPWLKREENDRLKAEKKGEEYTRVRPEESKLVKWAKKNMKAIQEADLEAMTAYAKADAEPTYELFKFFRENGLDMKTAKRYSMLAHVCVDYRQRGVRIDLDKAREVHMDLIPIIAQKHEKVYEIAGEEFNINSAKDMPRIFDKLKIKYPTSPNTGNPTITTPWMEKQTHELCKAIIEARQVLKIDRDFITKIIDMQEFTCPGADRYGRVYPELNLLRARTGRFSCTSPNIQQIPSRDPELGALCRSIFVPEEGDKWFSLDFSNQEGRLQVHYAYKLGCEGAAELKMEFDANPNLDMHQKVANLVGIERTPAKVINLGISYGMGIGKLAKALGLREGQAKVIRDKYNDLAPFLEQLNNKCKETLEEKGYIRTIGGRRSALDPPSFQDGKKRTFEYKALNKLIQGSAADQTIEAMIWAYKEGIPVTFPVHDQLCMSGTREQAERLQYIMEHAIELDIPSVCDVDLEGGDSWATAGH